MTILDLLREIPWFLYAVVSVFGLLIGSFLNVVIHRLPLMYDQAWERECRRIREEKAAEAEAEDVGDKVGGDKEKTPQDEQLTLWRPRSRCPSCGHTVTAAENVPILSWLVLRGKCSACEVSISVRYPLVELLTALLSVLVIWHFGPTLQGAAALLLTWALIALSFIDIDKQILPDEITLPWVWLGLLLSLFEVYTTPVDSIIGAAAGYLSLWLVYQGFKLATGKEGMGYGDFKLLALFGAWLGWQALPLIVLLSSVVGAVLGLTVMAIRRQDRSVPIPFGPYLAVAGFIALLWGDQLMTLWFGPLAPL